MVFVGGSMDRLDYPSQSLTNETLNYLFRSARSHHVRIYELVRLLSGITGIS